MLDQIKFTDWGQFILSLLTFILAFYIAYLGNRINKQSIKLDQSNVVIYSSEMILNLTKELKDKSILEGNSLNSWTQGYLNVYEMVCLSYLNVDIDENRFIRNRKIEIREIVESYNFDEMLFPSETSKYKAIMKVYSRFYNGLDK